MNDQELEQAIRSASRARRELNNHVRRLLVQAREGGDQGVEAARALQGLTRTMEEAVGGTTRR